MPALAAHLTAFFQERLPVERRASSHTSDSYAFKLLLQYASERLKVAPSQLQLEQLDAPLIVSFLNHLETARANGPSSRNVRLAAIKSFMHFMEFRAPSAMEHIRRILAIPPKKADTRVVRHLTVDERQAVLDAPEPTGWDGLRDWAMRHLGFAGGLRVSELVGLRLADLTLQPHEHRRSWQGAPRTLPAALENHRYRGASVVSGSGTGADARAIPQCPRPSHAPVRFRVHPRAPTTMHRGLSRVISLTYRLGSMVLGDLTYTYDGDGSPSAVGGSLARTMLPRAISNAVYDDASQLVEWATQSCSRMTETAIG